MKNFKWPKVFLSEIIWREFAVNLMFLYPNLDKENIKENFDHFKWDNNEENFKAWTKGNTGYPIVDAAMKELWDTGWMHNRARMITASFLTKHLLIPGSGELIGFMILIRCRFCFKLC